MLHLAGSSIRRQILFVSLVATTTALLLACASFLVYEVVTFRAAMVRVLNTHAEVIAGNSTAPVLFQDAKAATETLSALRAERAILYADLRLPDGSQFARYLRRDLAGPPEMPTFEGDEQYTFEPGRLVLTHALRSEGTVIANLFIHSDLREQTARIRRYLLITALILAAALVASIALSTRLERRISEPILALVQAARTVSDEKNFDVRVESGAVGEIGLLGKTFNEMLYTIEHQNAELRRAVAARDEFLSIASHELKTPLTPLQLQVQKLQLSARRDPASAENPKLMAGLEAMDRQVMRMTTLVHNLLDISRITSERLDLQPEEVDLAQLVREVAARFKQEMERAKCNLVVTAEHPVVGHWDRSRVDQVITNLVSNAMKYGSGKPIHVDLVGDDRNAILQVQDHGIGIAPQDQARIFERFERAVSSHSYGGFGLGLWIVCQIVEASGGHIAVVSKPGEGARFTVTLPRTATGLEST